MGIDKKKKKDIKPAKNLGMDLFMPSASGNSVETVFIQGY
jgi:hypothetical protein